jgi:hypothetical protein
MSASPMLRAGSPVVAVMVATALLGQSVIAMADVSSSTSPSSGSRPLMPARSRRNWQPTAAPIKSPSTADRFSHGFFSAELAKHGMSYSPSARDKSRLYLDSLPQIASPGRVHLLDIPAIPDQYSLLERKTGANGRDRVDARGNRHEDLVNTISAVIAMLATPLNGAEGWLEYYRRLNIEAGINPDLNVIDTDFDDVRPSVGDSLGWNFVDNSTWVSVKLPPVIATEGGLHVDGKWYGARRIGDDVTVDLPPAIARNFLAARPAFININRQLCNQLGILE